MTLKWHLTLWPWIYMCLQASWENDKCGMKSMVYLEESKDLWPTIYPLFRFVGHLHSLCDSMELYTKTLNQERVSIITLLLLWWHLSCHACVLARLSNKIMGNAILCASQVTEWLIQDKNVIAHFSLCTLHSIPWYCVSGDEQLQLVFLYNHHLLYDFNSSFY